ncbi:hypothetical protein P152DRAFT_461273 [Eremomyces bilateralis CBS 781.70]|uniref:Uncharacterized protein n=1 Tax=Eremomyces bilateralis CBS 781.70 TaxID=1392243 RepID=A0A6G1FVA6_9PEZI|nr:uncharacterized protein P152DRAFT_461273 [Eremomyces bilateralis CBS 781.70]KAF1809591.1 hypothetical protein P152DRAFT_461273 [Eremomyces bilateralis CBS 781.70]
MTEEQTVQTVTQEEEQAKGQTTIYNLWCRGDGLYEGGQSAKWISFKNGFVRVREKDWVTIREEGWASDTERSFYVPPWHSCEVLGSCEFKFTRA